jgi:hypothetical protein
LAGIFIRSCSPEIQLIIDPHYLLLVIKGDSLIKGAAPRFLDTKQFLFSMFKTDNVSHFDLKSNI